MIKKLLAIFACCLIALSSPDFTCCFAQNPVKVPGRNKSSSTKKKKPNRSNSSSSNKNKEKKKNTSTPPANPSDERVPKAVDLGLKSGVKWADINLGATDRNIEGNYYAWGETAPKLDYREETWNKPENYGSISGNPKYDAACSRWGSTWRIPTKKEWNELIQSCSRTWTKEKGVDGYKLTGPNGNSIFLPAGGIKEGKYVADKDGGALGSFGYYWTGDPNYEGAYSVMFNKDDIRPGWDLKYGGRNIRAVSK